MAKSPIDCIIETPTNEICCSSTYDELIGFWNIKTLKNTSKIKHYINGGDALCMITDKIMLTINIYGSGVSLINIFTHEIIKTFGYEAFLIV